jgi:hypothetical protein
MRVEPVAPLACMHAALSVIYAVSQKAIPRPRYELARLPLESIDPVWPDMRRAGG